MPVLTSSKSGPWEICIQVYIRYTCLNHDGIFIPEEIHVFFKAGSLPHSFSGRTPEVRSVWHIVSFSNTLEENSKVEVPVAPVDVEAETVSGRRVSDDGTGSGIAENTTSTVNNTDSVDILVNNITSLPVVSDGAFVDVCHIGIHFSL